jgi:hypothetical protein
LSQKQNTNKREKGHDSSDRVLASMNEALGSIPTASKKRKTLVYNLKVIKVGIIYYAFI